MVNCVLSLAACCLFLQDTTAHEQPDQIHTNNWWNSRQLFGDFQQRALRGEKDGFWAVRGKRSADMTAEDTISDQDMTNYISFLNQFLRDYQSPNEELSNYVDADEDESFPAESKRGIMKPNGLFGALAGKRSLVKPNGLFMSMAGKRGGLKPNGLFGNMGKRSYKPNGLFSLSGKRAIFKPNSLFNVHGKRSMSLKPNGFFSLDKRIFKPNGLFTAFKRGLKPNGLFSSYKRSMQDDLLYEDEDELLTQEPMEKKDDKNFWAVRGKKDDDFWAVRGKKPDDDFWAVRGKREVESADETKKESA